MIAPQITPEAVYDPIDLYVRLAREFHWSWNAMDEMDYAQLFACVDRLSRQHERENEDQERRWREARAGRSEEAWVDFGEYTPQVARYDGEIVPLYG